MREAPAAVQLTWNHLLSAGTQLSGTSACDLLLILVLQVLLVKVVAPAALHFYDRISLKPGHNWPQHTHRFIVAVMVTITAHVLQLSTRDQLAHILRHICFGNCLFSKLSWRSLEWRHLCIALQLTWHHSLHARKNELLMTNTLCLK